MDEGGNDHYRLGNLGLSAAHDNSTALFVDGAGDDIYEVDGTPCMALGASRMSDPDTARETLPNLGLFMDLGGRDRYPAHCAGVRNDAIWTVPRHSPATARPSQAGAGLDGEWPTPFSLPPLVPAHRGVLQ